MKAVLGVLAVIMLSGCESVAEIERNPAYATLATQRPAKEVAECVRDSWQNTPFRGTPYAAQLQQSGSSYRVLSPAGTQPFEIAMISEGTVSVHFMGGIFDARKENRLDALRPCL